jgi:hypothetical protein
MPLYKMKVSVPTLHENGLEFLQGQDITDNKGKVILVNLYEEEAATMNKWGVAGTELVLATDAEIKANKKADDKPEPKKKPYFQMNKAERAEFAKQKAEADAKAKADVETKTE